MWSLAVFKNVLSTIELIIILSVTLLIIRDMSKISHEAKVRNEEQKEVEEFQIKLLGFTTLQEIVTKCKSQAIVYNNITNVVYTYELEVHGGKFLVPIVREDGTYLTFKKEREN